MVGGPENAKGEFVWTAGERWPYSLPMKEKLDELGVSLSPDVEEQLDDLVALRRDLHAHPELAGEERRTQKVVMDFLAAEGIEARPMADTGVLASVTGLSDGPVLLLRADMDALPINEIGQREYKSTIEGVMHACGHDGHTAMLMIASRILKRRGLPGGVVKLMFQPAEEGGGGAARMIEEGLLDSPRPDGALAFHVWSGHQIGEAAVLDGPVITSVDGFEMVVTGRGTHAAMPEDGVDPVVLTSRIITGAQDIITRRKPAFEPAVLSFTSIQGGSAFNVIPQEVRVKGTLRTFSRKIRALILEDLQSFAAGVSSYHGAHVDFDFFEELGPTINDPAFAAEFREVASGVVGEQRLTSPHPLMGGEDMGLVLRAIPGALVLLGCGNPEDGIDNPHHHPMFDMDERVLAIGVELFVRFAERFLSSD